MSHSHSDKTPLLLHPRVRKQLFDEGAEFFNNDKFFEAHEVWEKLWRLESDPERTFLQGFILTAAHFIHIQKHNWSGATSVAAKAIEKITTALQQRRTSMYGPIDLEPVLSALDYNLILLAQEGEELTADKFLFPKLM